MDKPDVATPAERWTRIDDYLGGVRRRLRSSRQRQRQRTEPEAPRAMLSTIPFAALIGVLAMLMVAIAVTAWPPSQPEFPLRTAERELGTAPPGWFEKAKKEFR
ncbi:MAG TPA: hypothetical protein VHN55_09840 [Sphingomicrobium sp.]|nr:hypothetical protein [Sphingomicrobium sp.]